MKKIIAAMALAGTVWAAAPAVGQEVVEEIVVVVNDDIITLSDCRETYERRVAELRAQQVPPEEYDRQLEFLKKELLELMITDLLLLQKAKELDLNVQEQLKAMIEKLKQDNNIASDADLRRAIEQQGMPYEVWLREYEEGIMRQGVLYTEIERAIVLEDAEVVQYYRQNPAEFTEPTEYTLNAVYVAGESRTAEEAEAIKAAIDAKLASGAPFADAAAELSAPPLKEAKGELGTFKAGELEPALGSPLEGLAAGETTGWINARNAWYRLQLVEKKDSRLLSFEEARPQVEQKLYNQKRAVETEAFLKRLREESYVKVLNADPLGFNK
ncbi:MAG: peptidyl-prolyl cis-trans isomerase [Candidatus Aminicenantes bacterium]|nr:peptidyl-prolyl cis-trans isomerase [Candidatus Aminicenantes bacterium]